MRQLPPFQDNKKIKILIVASADSPLLNERAHFPHPNFFEIIWFSESFEKPRAWFKCYHAKKNIKFDIFFRLIAIFKFWRAYFIEKPDIVHVHWCLFPALLMKRSWHNLIVSPMGSDILIDGWYGLRKIISRSVLLRAQIITSKSNFMDRKILNLSIEKSRLKRITWGIDKKFYEAFERKKSAREKLNLAENMIAFFSPRSQTSIYRVDKIISAFRNYVLKGGEGVLLVSEMYGSEQKRNELERILVEPSVKKKVKFLGALSQNEMIECYAASDAVISYAASDGLPQTLFETMAAGCFPIFTDLPQYESLLEHKVNAYLCDPQDAQTLEHGFEFAAQAITRGDFIEINRELSMKHADRHTEIHKINRIYTDLYMRASVFNITS